MSKNSTLPGKSFGQYKAGSGRTRSGSSYKARADPDHGLDQVSLRARKKTRSRRPRNLSSRSRPHPHVQLALGLEPGGRRFDSSFPFFCASVGLGTWRSQVRFLLPVFCARVGLGTWRLQVRFSPPQLTCEPTFCVSHASTSTTHVSCAGLP